MKGAPVSSKSPLLARADEEVKIKEKDETCINTEGSYKCKCPHNHRKIDGVCVDIDECTEGTHFCDSNARCENRKGTYICKCNYGFDTYGDGFVGECYDRDECTEPLGDSLSSVRAAGRV